MTLSVRSVALGAVVSISMAMTAQAATVYSDRASFDAATGSLALETFDTPIARAPVITFDGGIKASRSGTTNSPNEVNSGSYVGLVTRTGSNQITFDFGQTIDSFGADFSGVASLFADLLGTEESVIIAASSQPAGFFGFISDTPFSQLTFRTRAGIVRQSAFQPRQPVERNCSSRRGSRSPAGQPAAVACSVRRYWCLAAA